jgi:tetratricopeptide (TPR) repeat protein
MKLPNLLRAIVCALALLISVPVFAQMGGSSMSSTPKDSTKDKPSKSSKSDKNENKYPNATRKEPKLDMSSGDQKDLNKAADLLNDSKGDQAEPIVQKVIASEKSSKYAQAFAHQLLAQIYWEKDKNNEAIAEYRKAIELDALPNDAHFQVLYQIAQLQIQDEKYADALTTLDQWEKMTGATTADEMALKANAYYRTDKFQEAIDTMKKAIAASDKPNDSWTQILMASYFELNQYDQAAQVVQEQLQKNPTDK